VVEVRCPHFRKWLARRQPEIVHDKVKARFPGEPGFYFFEALIR
jgi:hypothetical protein